MDKEKYNNQFNNMYNGFGEDYGNSSNSNYYSENIGDYAEPMNNNLGYQESQWDVQVGQNYNNYVNNEYNYYDDNIGYMYNDRYEIDYSNSSSNYSGYEYGYDYNYNYNYNQYDVNGYNVQNQYNNQDSYSYNNINNYNNIDNSQGNISINELSNKMNMDLDANMFFDGFASAPDFNNDSASNNSGGVYQNGAVNNNGYGAINSDAAYFNRNNSMDNKMIPTEDITFDDMYVVRNQLFEDEEKLFGFNDIISLALCVAFAIIMAFLINEFAGQVTTVDGPSMEYNFHDKEVLVLDKLSYRLKEPERYDVVVFPVGSGGEHKFYIKRIIGLPGEKIHIDVDKSEIYANVKKLDDIYGWEKLSGYGKQVDTNNITLNSDEYYVMGDNRNNSEDSRSSRVGPIKRADFVGKAIFKISPIGSFGPIDHKYNSKIMTGKNERPYVLE